MLGFNFFQHKAFACGPNCSSLISSCQSKEGRLMVFFHQLISFSFQNDTKIPQHNKDLKYTSIFSELCKCCHTNRWSLAFILHMPQCCSLEKAFLAVKVSDHELIVIFPSSSDLTSTGIFTSAMWPLVETSVCYRIINQLQLQYVRILQWMS